MSIEACAALVEQGDPVRFVAAMAAPVAARRVLFPLYAFNLQVARAPWVTQEPMIAEMRLQWWRDALAEIAADAAPRRHEVVTPLADILDTEGATLLDALIEARRWDVYKDPFRDQIHFERYLTRTTGNLIWVAARALGAGDVAKDPVRGFGRATGLARFLQAVRALEASGRIPLVDGRPETIAALARSALADARTRAGMRRAVPPGAWPALIEGWQTAPLLKQIANKPARVATAGVGLSPFRARLRLLAWA